MLTSLKKHSLARKQDKSTNFCLLERRNLSLEICIVLNLSKLVENQLSYGLQKTKNLFESRLYGLCFVVWVVTCIEEDPYSFNCILFIGSSEQTFSKHCLKSLRKCSFFQER